MQRRKKRRCNCTTRTSNLKQKEDASHRGLFFSSAGGAAEHRPAAEASWFEWFVFAVVGFSCYVCEHS